jgi:hypothetical protein
MKTDKNIKNFSDISSATNPIGLGHNTCPLNVLYEADKTEKAKYQISLPGVCPLPTGPPRLIGHHIPPLEPTPMMI